MRNLYLFLAALFLTLSASSQNVHFMYFQTESGAPFYLKMGEKIYSSSATGYLTLSNLADSNYQFTMGLAATQSEGRFNLPAAGRDRGFLLKNMDYGLGLFDLQTQSITRPQEDVSNKIGLYQLRTDDFTRLLSKASGDTSLLYVLVSPKSSDIALKEEPKQEQKSIPAEEKPKIEEKPKVEEVVLKQDRPQDSPVIDSGIAAKTQELKPDSAVITAAQTTEPQDSFSKAIVSDLKAIYKAAGSDTAVAVKDSTSFAEPGMPAEEFKRSVIKKYSESSTSEGFGLIYHDNHGDGVDTIRLLIPNPRIVFKQPDTTAAEDASLFLDLKKTPSSSEERPAETKKMLPRSDCPAIASNTDFMKLRRTMAAQETDEAMVESARKYFRNKCFSTEQVKNLSTLFLTSAGKYQFFDAAYLHVTDQSQFPGLAAELKDDYYLKRFKALIGE